MKRIIRAVWRRFTWFLCRFFPINPKKIVLTSYYGKGYGDNPKYIAEQLLKSDQNYKIVWLVNGDSRAEDFPKGIILAKEDSFKGIFHITTARVWVDNCRTHITFG